MHSFRPASLCGWIDDVSIAFAVDCDDVLRLQLGATISAATLVAGSLRQYKKPNAARRQRRSPTRAQHDRRRAVIDTMARRDASD